MIIDEKDLGLPAPVKSKAEKALETTTARGGTLLSDGYRIDMDAEHRTIFHVSKTPELLQKRPLKKGEQVSYEVIIGHRADGSLLAECECGAYRQLGTCKHGIAIARALLDAVALLAPVLGTTRVGDILKDPD